jgi:alpha-L-fucosidase
VSKNSWGYVQEQDYKTATSIVHDLVDIVSKNGALLLNIGPRPDGTIPESEEETLLEIGRWLAVNGEAIYGTRPWKVYGEGPTEIIEGDFQDTKRAGFTPRDIRFTTQGDTLYAVVLGWPESGETVIESLGTDNELYPNAIQLVEVLGSEEAVQWSRGAGGLKVRLPSQKPADAAFVLKVTRG